MRLCAWAGARRLLSVLVLLTASYVQAEQQLPVERHYYIAAVEIDWNYSGNDWHRFGSTYKKVVFREYDKDFQQAKTHPSWLGLLGPTLRAEEGETIVVTFKNMATGPHSIHPHGIAYGKQSEGAQYFDNTSLKEKEDDVVQPNSKHVYYWEVTADVSPQKNDPTCLTYTYISHANFVEDFNSGLIGALLICKPGSLNESGKQIAVHQEYVFLFGVFDENKSKYKPNSYSPDDHVKYTINGFSEGSLPDVSVCAHAPVSLHMMGMSSDPEVFSVHINGQVLQQTGHKVSSVGLISGSTTTVSMVALHTGRWLMSSHIVKHMQAEMHGFIDVGKCDGFDAPQRRLTIQQRRESTEWTYYIAAEEIVWDYAPGKQEHIDEDFKAQYLKQSPTRIGSKYKKAVYILYKNESFTEKLETKQRKNELGILGPVIRAQIRDVIKIVFKNKASRPYSIYPHGLTIEKSEEGVNYPLGSNQSHGVLPGETHTYIWRVVDEDEPLDSDSRCLTRMYHSAVNTPRDIASGLIGPILICKSASLNVRNVQLRADKEQHAVFSMFDENKSWYLDDNIRRYCDRSRVNKADPDFYKSNVMHTINGYVFETGPLLGFCNGEVATWHVSSVGAQDYIQTATFYGHRFKLNDRIEDFMSLYPMTGETITMDMDNIGVWLLASLNSHETTKGIRVKFQDVECFRDYEYELNDYGDTTVNNEFTLWKPPSMDEIEKEKHKQNHEPKVKGEVDFYTDSLAEQLGLRSFKSQSGNTDVEKLDLSFLDYDAIDVNDGDTVSSALTEKKNTNNTFILKPNAQNKTLVPTRKEVDILNHTAIHLRNQSSSENATNDTKRPTMSPKSDSASDNRQTNLTLPLEGNSSATLETMTMYVTLTGNKQASVDMITTENSEERLNRGDAFSYFELSSNETTVTLQNTSEDETEIDVIVSADGMSQTLSAPELDTEEGNVSSKNRHNVTAFQSEMVSPHNKDNDSRVTTAEVDYSLNTTSNSSLENVTNIWLEPGNKLNETSLNETFSNDTTDPVASTVSVPSYAVMSSSEELLTSDSEEVFIYLKENKTDLIKTTSVKVQGHNWAYDGTHQTVPMEIPEDMLKYLGKETPRATPAPKKRKKVNLRHRPLKGQGMKTKRKKEYKPQPRSGLPFSPRGFNPGLSPRGSRPLTPQPVSDEDDLGNNPVVIGVPRMDFSDYELYIPGDEPDHLGLDGQNVKADEYEYVSYKDPYSSHEDVKDFHLDMNTKYFLKNSGPNVRTYFIAAEEVQWDYGGYGQRRQEMLHNSRETKFTKVVFRRYMDISFTTPEVRGEIDEHLGILGPVIKAEVGQTILIIFKNNAKRPYSLHPNGVSYIKRTEGLSYEDGSKYWHKYDNEVQPGKNFTYIWKVPAAAGPNPDESHCRTWVYYSGVNPEKDIHSGLIGPLLVCREGTLAKELIDTRQFTLLFMTFDETQSWYFEKNQETMQRKSRRRFVDPDKKKFLFHSINGIIFNLKGLRMYTNQLVSWHLINMGSPRDYQSVHFHGQTFLHKKTTSYRQAVFPLLPGGFATLEMYPSKPGLWLLETEVGLNQKMGMQTLFLVLDDDCSRPLGLESGSIKDNQITAISTRGYWEPYLARLNNQGKYNAWSTEDNSSWIQVDFQRPVVISQVATQGARQMFYSQFVMNYYISYSTDRRKWVFYKGDSADLRKEFTGNHEAYETKTNTLFPPVIGRFIRLHPTQWYNKATVRMEFYGCELDGCSVPLGMESGEIEDHRITASSTASSWYSGPWTPELARLNKQGTINAWQAKYSDMNQWLQVELPEIKKITGIVTQGARSLGTEMYVISYSLQYSNNGIHWQQYTDDESIKCKIFLGNTNNSDHVKNYIYPPIFARYIRIVPKSWMNSITLRIELLGCEFE